MRNFSTRTVGNVVYAVHTKEQEQRVAAGSESREASAAPIRRSNKTRFVPIESRDELFQPSVNPIRDDMAEALPGFVQPFLTWLTAKPATGEAYRETPPVFHVASAAGATLLGGFLTVLAVLGGGLWLLALPITWIITASGMGKLQAVVYHHCSHDTVFKTRRLHGYVGDAVAGLLLLKHFPTYRREHMRHHNAKHQFTQDDEFQQFIDGTARLVPGLDRGSLRRRVLFCLVSPRFHFRFLMSRFASCFPEDVPLRNTVVLLSWVAVLGTVALTSGWVPFLIAWVLPVTILLQIGTALRIFVEHRIPEQLNVRRRDRWFVSEATAGVFCGRPVPAPGQRSFVAWTAWWAEMLTLHLLTRVFVLPGDAPAHDYHHRFPASTGWANCIHERQRDVVNGCPSYPQNYIEHWGLLSAIDDLISGLSKIGTERAEPVIERQAA